MTILRRKFSLGIRLKPTTTAVTKEGELSVDPSDMTFKVFVDGSGRDVLTADQTQTIINKTISADSNTVTDLDTTNLRAGTLITDVSTATSDTELPSALAVKTALEGQNEAAEIAYDPSDSSLTQTNVKTSLDEVAGRLDTNETNISSATSGLLNHIVDPTDAHAASAITNTPAGNLVAITVQGALDEIQTELDSTVTATNDHIANTTGAHAATAIASTPSGNLAATDVQGALDELQTELDGAAAATDLTTHEGLTAAHGVTGDIVGTTDAQSLSNKTLATPLIKEVQTIVGPGTGTITVNKPVVELTGTYPFINGIENVGNVNQDITIINKTGADIPVLNDGIGVSVFHKIYTGTDNDILLKNNASISVQYLGNRNYVVGGTGSGTGTGGINYLGNNGDADNGLGDWLDLANGTVAVNETTPLSGDADFVFTQGVETGGIADCLFTIDKAGLVRKQYLSFDYDLSSLTSTIQTYPIHVTITDATGVTLYSSTISTLTENKQGTFLTDFQIDPSVSVYKLNFSRVAAGPPPEAISFNIDNIRVAPREVTKSIGKTSYTVSFNSAFTFSLNESNIGSSVTNPSTGTYRVYYNKSRFPNNPIITPVINESGGTGPWTTTFKLFGSDGTGDYVDLNTIVNGNAGANLSGTDELQVTFTQKEEDQTAYQISTDLGNRLIHSYGIKPLGASVANTSIKWVADTDTVGMYNDVTGQWEIPSDGVYVFNGSYDAGSSQVRSFHIYKNNVLLASIHDSDVNQVYKLNYQGLFKQGDLVDIRIPTSATAIGATAYTTYMSVSKQGNDAPMLGVTAPQIAIFKDVKASGVAAGSSTAGAFNTRELNSHSGLSTFATLSSNLVTLEPGKYTIDASAPAWFSNGHQLRMYNVTNAAVLVDDNGDDCYGSVSWSSSAAIDRSQGSFVITINAPTTIRLEHRVAASKATDGLGNALSFGLEVYAMLKIQKVY